MKGENVMEISNKKNSEGLTRRDLLKGSGVLLGGLALGGAMAGVEAGKAMAEQSCAENSCGYPNGIPTDQYDYPNYLFKKGDIFDPNKDTASLAENEMRITFLGTAFPPSRKAQQMMSIFVEVGPWQSNLGGGVGKATDSFVFDCGAGVMANYNAMGIPASRMDKIFISHLHADHMSDLSAIYCFGAAADRKWPLYVWSHGPSGMKNPKPPGRFYDDGVNAFCKHLREAMRWHSESMSFLNTAWTLYPIPTRKEWGLPCDPIPVGDDAPNDGYAMVPIQLDWTKYGQVPGDNIAYHNEKTGVKITHFPVIHCRKGSMGFKLEWNGLSMIYTSDTRPETHCIAQANNVDPLTNIAKGVDVFIHEMILPPELLAMKTMRLDAPDYTNPKFDLAVREFTNIEKSSHTPQGAFGYLLSQINPKPKLSVIAHFPVADDTVECAMNSVHAHFPNSTYPVLNKDILWSTDLMVLTVKKEGNNVTITQRIGVVSDYTFGPPSNVYAPLAPAKYATATAQLDQSTLIDSGENTYCENGY
jgi:ribonuclease Z